MQLLKRNDDKYELKIWDGDGIKVLSQTEFDELATLVARYAPELLSRDDRLDGFVCRPMPGEPPYKVWMPNEAIDVWLHLVASANSQPPAASEREREIANAVRAASAIDNPQLVRWMNVRNQIIQSRRLSIRHNCAIR